MIFCYNALPMIGIKLTAIEAGGLALALNEAPFIAEIIRGNVVAVDRGQIIAGQALGMTPVTVMLRIVAPQAIRAMVPALGNEAVSALKNSSLASVVSVQELTLRSTQLASANFDFFSIFFASGLMYLVLTGAVAVIQIVVEILLDLDLPTPQARLARLLPWRRKPIETVRATAVADTAPSRSPPAARPQSSPSRPAPLRASLSIDHEKRLIALGGSRPAVEIKALHKSYDGKTVLESIDLVVRIGEVVALLGPSGSGKSTLLRCISHLESWDSGSIRVTGRNIGFDAQNRPLSPRAIVSRGPTRTLAPESCSIASGFRIAPRRCRATCPAGSSNAWRSPARSPPIRRFCFSTSPLPPSTPTSYTEGFSHFVTSMTAPVASGWSGCRVGLPPTEKRRLLTANTSSGHWRRGRVGPGWGKAVARA
jgi:polar amino acid transport system permease protein